MLMINKILIVDDEQDYLDSVKRYLLRAGLNNFRLDNDPRKTVASLEKGDSFDVALLDITMPHLNGIQLLEIIKKMTPNTECIMVTALSDARIASDCINKGAYAYLVKPISGDDLINTINRALERRRFLEILNNNKTDTLPDIVHKDAFDKIKTFSEKIVRLMREAEIYALNHGPVLISGEEGTGKLLFAEAIHNASPRSCSPFVIVDADEIGKAMQPPFQLGEYQNDIGGLEPIKKAHKGTLLIRELGELPLDIQDMLLRYIQDKEQRGKSLIYDARIMFTTKHDVRSLLEKGLLKKHLYYNLNKAWIHLPPLRDRKEDIPLLINSIFEELRGCGQSADIDEDAFAQLLYYDYPRNIAELKNIIKSLTELAVDRKITLIDLPDQVNSSNKSVAFDSSITIPKELLENLKENYLLRELWCPLESSNGRVTVIVDNPKNLIKQDEIMRLLKAKNIDFLKSDRHEIIKFIKHFYSTGDSGKFDEIIDEVENIQLEIEQHDDEKETSESDSVVRRIVNAMINDAYKMRSTDIHIEPDVHKRCVSIRFRVDGECEHYKTAPYNMKSAIVSRIKIMSDLDITERRLPQDGKIRIKLVDGSVMELRVATLPTVGGLEDVSLRLLARNELVDLDDLNMTPRVHKEFLSIITRPYGLVLCVGPTGSGKTTTLHAAIHKINKPGVRILTIEDPVEITQPGIRQVQVNRKIGLDFPKALRAFLRADPDVIMVGEMRDFETAKIGIEASLTGHLVFSTLHTNNAPETIIRLLDMGLDPYNFGDSLLGVVAQRLVKLLCSKCKEPYQPSSEVLGKIVAECGSHNESHILNMDKREMQFHKANGCKQCNHTGYYGRMGIFELLPATDSLKKLIVKKESADKIREAAIGEGMSTLLREGLMSVVKGLTDFEQVKRVCMR
jgi:type II secretory ATPase GspE/PulE/Tfp pilus assembly ATPase PilB-like protein/transcriptional regulator with PAS, ATPase and Fis domain